NAQYQLNLGAVLVRLNLDLLADLAFKRAADLNKQDIESALMAIAVNPASGTAAASGFAAQYEKLRTTDDDWRSKTPWAHLTNEDRIGELDGLVEYQVRKDEESAYRQLREDAADRIE